MKIQIKNRYSGSVLFETEAESLGAAVMAAIAAKTDLERANLEGAYLCGANLERANLYGANLYGANLYGANLYGANLYGTNLEGAYLYSANLYGANLERANLYGANLYGANLERANLYGAKIPQDQLASILATRTILADGEIIGWKKLRGGVICKLRIPAEAKRVGGLIGRKCRCEFAYVLEGEGVSIHNQTTEYRVGEKVTPDKYDPNPLVECSCGIHFFITRREAEDYV